MEVFCFSSPFGPLVLASDFCLKQLLFSIGLDCVYLDLQGLSKNDEDWKNSSFFRLEFYR